jgi:hypothetical protein
MASGKVQIELDSGLVERARARAGADAESDSDAIAAAVTAFLGFGALDEAHALGGLPPEDADRLAVDEVRAYRAKRGRAG